MTSPTTIGPYRVVRSLGQGGMGEVVLAYDDRLRRHVALKSVTRDSGGTDARALLVHEARAAAALSHPGIASIFDILEEQDRAYIVMEYVEGETLAERLRRGEVPRAEALEIAFQLCDALESAHQQGVIHRDLKPGNIMLGGGRAKILDFGLAKRAAVTGASAPTASAISVVGHRVAGTVGYMAPEQVMAQAVDHRCDIFSLGAVLFQLFTGHRAFAEHELIAYGVRVTTADAPRADAISPPVGAPISRVIAAAMARDRGDRFASAAALKHALQAAAAPAVTETMQPAAGVPRRHSRGLMAMAAGLAVAVAGALALVALPRTTFLRSSTAPPAVLAIMPAVAQDIDPALQGVAVALTTIATANLATVPGLNAVPGNPSAAIGTVADLSQAMQRIGATWALQTSLRSSNGTIASEISLRKVGETTPAWRDRFEGDALTVVRRALLSIASGVVEAGLTSRLDEPARQRLTAIGTDHSAAFLEYAHGRRLLAGVTTVEVLSTAIPHFNGAVNNDPQFALAWAGLAESLRRRYQQAQLPDDINRAIDAANRAAAIDPGLAAVQLTLASVFNLSGRSADALAAVDRAIALQPSADDAYRLRGPILIQSNRNDEGIEALQHAVTLRPFYSNYETLGFYLYRVGRLQESADAYRRVTELAPDYAGGYQGLGTALHRIGQVEEAIGHYEHAVRLGPSATAYSNLAYSYYETGRYNDAVAAYREAIKRDSRRPTFHRNIGDVYQRIGRRAEARAAYLAAIEASNAVLKVNANDASTIALVALCEAKLGQSLAAERHAAEALSLAPKSMEVAVRNAEVYAILRQPSRALRHLGSAMQLGYDRTSLAKNDELKTLAAEPEFKRLTDRETDQNKRE